MLDLARLGQSHVASAPFAHIVMPQSISSGDLKRLVDELPEIARGGSYPVNALNLSGLAGELIRELEGDQFRSIIEQQFGLNLQAAPTMITLRGQCRQKDGRVHRDSSSKRVTVLLYLNPCNPSWAVEGGALRLLRGPDDLEDFEVEVPPSDGALLVFPNTPTSWHGHRPFVGRRYVLQMNYMSDDRAARGELRRHRFSAVVKRLLVA